MEGKQFNVRPTYSFLFVFLLGFQPHVTEAQSPNYAGDDCNSTTPKSLSNAYKTNLNNVLSWLSLDAATSKGYNHNNFGNNTVKFASLFNTLGAYAIVYGLYDCRVDVVGYFCQFRVSTAAREVLQRCPNRASAFIFYYFCILRFSSENFFGEVSVYPPWNLVGIKDVSSAEEIHKLKDFMRSLIRKATVETNQLYYMDVLVF
ncbi:unnamed protein product [Sphenostylis stenocarpa]|uniref:Gnk2-homologous domain-containing protein n=1 Tax=Sphenostylis stenocarpa TaxID=92480 RepID=A0AA86W4G3_9FABA|nr:unnamed protein product [Sphenostylis stenocarpa]